MNNSIYSTGKTRLFITGLSFLLLFALSCTAHAGSKDFPAPSWLKTTQIADDMIINGLPSQVRNFEANKAMEELLLFYRGQWQNDNTGNTAYKEAQAPPWYIISRFDGQYLYTVQVRQENSFTIRGYLAIADLKAVNKNQTNNSIVPKMSGSTIINDATSLDPGTKGRTLMLTNTYSATSNSNFYRNYYSDRGWGKIMDTNSKNTFVMAFKKRNKETNLVISNSGGTTQIVMNISEEI